MRKSIYKICAFLVVFFTAVVGVVTFVIAEGERIQVLLLFLFIIVIMIAYMRGIMKESDAANGFCPEKKLNKKERFP